MSDTIRPVTLPDLPLTGGCSCGKVRYAIGGVPQAFYLCHCTECQRHTSSAFGMSLRVDPATVTVTGEMKTISRTSDSGATRYGDFCPECGVRIQHRSKDDPGRLNIKAGTLDDTAWLIPAGHIWVSSKQAYVVIGEDELAYPQQPEDKAEAIKARWRAMLEAGRTQTS
ncbi:GFA family protein [Fulvimarina sp. 2208YS6-2-32]|uniref:GFA family protein n=1 Tax=Fulvimarina uroteuthidis TaxID=3098149 RepID=A0ABU5I1W8_9HYPH|nr:GFA family protein [Fulvimarina sp. 2208YS6-2-32]MDY8109365.1 GFA family protein [Fulvimarina sp. 2208YS6-2-32]